MKRRTSVWSATGAAIVGLALVNSYLPVSQAASGDKPTGWAAEGSGTNGGVGGKTVRPKTAAEFLAAISSSDPLIVEVDQMFELPKREPSEILPADAPDRVMHAVTSNKTITGVTKGAGISGGGLNIGPWLKMDCEGKPIATTCTPAPDQGTSAPPDAVSNVIIKNLVFKGSSDDDMNIQQFSRNILIDHNDFSGAADGALDIKRGSDRITISYNHFHDQDKNILIGHNDENKSQDQGRLRVTVHHNLFDGTGQRNPRVRFGNPVHVFNNYYKNVKKYGVASTVDAGVLVEANFFEGTEDAFHVGEAASGPGTILAKDNLFDGGPEATSAGAGRVDKIPYSYTPDQASQVKQIVTANAGPKI